VVALDLARAKRLSLTGWRQEDRVVVCWHTVPDVLADRCEEALTLLREWRRLRASIAVDTETTVEKVSTTMTCKLRTIAISAYGSRIAVAVPVNNELPSDLRDPILHEIRELLWDDQIAKIGNNLVTFDITVLERHGFPMRGPIFDGLVMSHVLDTGLPHGLDAISTYYTDTDAWKAHHRQLEKRGSGTMTDLLYYNGRDAVASAKNLPPMWQLAEETGQVHVIQKQTEWSDIARRMEVVGVHIDMPRLRELQDELQTKRDKHLEAIKQATGWQDINLRKPAHKAKFLFEILKLPVRKFTKKKMQPSTSYKGVLDFLENPMVQMYVEWDEFDDSISYLEGYAKRVLPDGRLHPSWNPTAQIGPRFSSQPNVQNCPEKFRSVIAAPPGRVIVAADEAQLEFRIITAFSGCLALLKAFANGDDAHMMTTRSIYGQDIASRVDAKTLHDLRYTCKRVIYGLFYGAGAKTVTRSIKEDKRTPIHIRARLNEGNVARIIQGIFRAYPEIPLWRTAILDFANANGYLEIPPLGRRCTFQSVPVDATKAFNYPIQWSAGDIVALAFLQMEKRLPTNAHIIIHGHDSVAIECDEGDAELVAQIEEECLEYSLAGPAGPVRLYAEAHWGKNYEDMPNSLKKAA
jgi:DNA polymerase-1